MTNAMNGLEFGHFPRRGSVLQPRVAVLGYPGKDGKLFRNPKGVVAKPARSSTERIAFDGGALPQPHWGCQDYPGIPKSADKQER
jgi:hypothetical protein